MIYYFVSWDGHITSEDNVRQWYEADAAFTNRKQAIAVARKRTKARIAELREYYKEVKCYRHTE